jgi:hypothetical protein
MSIRPQLLLAVLALAPLPACLSASSADAPPIASDDRSSLFGVVCEAELDLAGSFAMAAPQPSDVFGCWPTGTWRFRATVKSSTCATAPTLAPEYAFRVSRDADDTEVYEYLTDPAHEFVRIKVTSGGAGLCEGGVLIYSDDGKTVLNLRPALMEDATLAGRGEYELYDVDQR